MPQQARDDAKTYRMDKKSYSALQTQLVMFYYVVCFQPSPCLFEGPNPGQLDLFEKFWQVGKEEAKPRGDDMNTVKKILPQTVHYRINLFEMTKFIEHGVRTDLHRKVKVKLTPHDRPGASQWSTRGHTVYGPCRSLVLYFIQA